MQAHVRGRAARSAAGIANRRHIHGQLFREDVMAADDSSLAPMAMMPAGSMTVPSPYAARWQPVMRESRSLLLSQ